MRDKKKRSGHRPLSKEQRYQLVTGTIQCLLAATSILIALYQVKMLTE